MRSGQVRSPTIQGAMIQLKKPPDEPVDLPGPAADLLVGDVEAPGGEPAQGVKEDSEEGIGIHRSSMSPGIYLRLGRSQSAERLTPSFFFISIPAKGGPMLKKHPRALAFIFFTEMWERVGFYTLMAILVLYMDKVLGWSDARKGDIYGLFLALCYFVPAARRLARRQGHRRRSGRSGPGPS